MQDTATRTTPAADRLTAAQLFRVERLIQSGHRAAEALAIVDQEAAARRSE